LVDDMNKLYLTYCSAKKRPGIYTPERLYVSERIVRFINHCETAGFGWAILSALYGLFFPDEERKDYNVTFRTDKNYWLGIAVLANEMKLSYDESKQHVSQLSETLLQQRAKSSFERIVLYGSSPMMMKCYLGLLHYTFDKCSIVHGWFDLIEHVKNKSKVIEVIHKFGDQNRIGGEDVAKPSFKEVWKRIVTFEGEEFKTVRNLPFKYEVKGDYLIPSRTDYNISKSDFAETYPMVPLSGPGEITKTVRGSSYVYAILHDERISNKEW
jgi:hypothetical protein